VIEKPEGGSEWAAHNWNPNAGKWLFYSSKNTCSSKGASYRKCSKNMGGF